MTESLIGIWFKDKAFKRRSYGATTTSSCCSNAASPSIEPTTANYIAAADVYQQTECDAKSYCTRKRPWYS